MIYEFEVREEAQYDTIETVAYYEEQQTGLGDRFLTIVVEYFNKIRKNPKHYPVTLEPLREVYVQKFPYVIVYEIVENKVVVYSVFNTYQNPEKKFRNY